MADSVRKVEYFSIHVPNKPAQAFNVLSTLVVAGVDLIACTGIPRGRRAEIHVVPQDARKFKAAVRKAGLEFTAEKSGYLIQGDDRRGALAVYLGKLGNEGINVIGIDALSAGAGRFGAIIWIDREDVKKTARLLGVSVIARNAATKRSRYAR